jgi:hypothetical protein
LATKRHTCSPNPTPVNEAQLLLQERFCLNPIHLIINDHSVMSTLLSFEQFLEQNLVVPAETLENARLLQQEQLPRYLHCW